MATVRNGISLDHQIITGIVDKSASVLDLGCGNGELLALLVSVETYVLEMIGEDTDAPDVFTDDSIGMTQIRDSINDAVEEISIVTNGYREKYKLVLRQDRNFYKIDFSRGRFGWITDAWLLGSKRRLEQTSIARLNAYNPRWMQNSGSPEAYFPIGIDYIGVWPHSSGDNDIIEFHAIAIPDRYSEDTDRIKLKDDFAWAAAHFAVGEYYASRGDAKSAIYHHNKYLERLGINTQYPFASEKEMQLQTMKDYWSKNKQ